MGISRMSRAGVRTLVAGGALLLGACEGDVGPMGAAGAAGAAGADGVDAGTLPAAACAAVTPLPAGLPASAVALTAAGKLVRFTPGSGAGGNELVVLGLGAGESLVGIDFRPADGALIGVVRNGTAGSLVRINPATGETTRLNLNPTATPLTLAGASYGVDFNPVPGALRVVGDNEENYRITFGGTNLATYTVLADTALNPAGNVVGAAYTNSFAGTPQTTLYVLDSAANALLVQGGVDGATNPNSGVLTTVGAANVDFEPGADLDVDGVSGVALAALNLAGAVSTGVYAVDLGTGAALCVGTVPAREGDLAVDLAIPAPNPALAYGLTTGGGLVTFTPNAAGVAAVTGPVAITGLQSGTEVIVGLDARPRTGALTLVTRDPADATVNLGRLYEVNSVTGVATPIPANGTALDFADAATAFGVDFNPVPNALRIVNDAGQNFRLTFPAGTAGYTVVTDAAINPAGTSSAAAYTHNFDGTGATRLYVLDTVSGELKFQNPPNDGTQTVVGSLGVAAADHLSGFDIVGSAGVAASGANVGNAVAFAALTVGGASNLYRLNLETGAATQVGSGPIGGGAPVSLQGLAVVVRK